MFRRILSHRPFSHKNFQHFKYGKEMNDKQVYKELYAEIEKTNTRIDEVLIIGIFPLGISAATVFFSLLKNF